MALWFKEYLLAKEPGAAWDPAEDLAVRFCMRFSDDAELTRYVVHSADAFIAADKCTPSNAKTLFFALEKTGEDKYREAICGVMARLDAQPEAAPDLSAAYETLPFRMAYEMKLNRMERVGRTAAMYCDVHKHLWNHKAQSHGESLQAEGWFLMALMDGIECCSDQLYEHWRALVDIYRVTLRGVLPGLETADARTQALLLYGLMRGVERGLIDPERYLPVARKGIALLRAKGEERAADMLEEGFGVL
ncbi:MAG: hypothetical protein IKL25_02405 [Clostridia bacterium]|nr:hypothetical protein [Clostridia bacterium]